MGLETWNVSTYLRVIQRIYIYIYMYMYLALFRLLLGIATLIFVRTRTCMVLGSEARSGFVGTIDTIPWSKILYLSLPLATARVLSMYCVPCPISEVFLHCTCGSGGRYLHV